MPPPAARRCSTGATRTATTNIGKSSGDVRARFVGDRFTQEEINQASRDLKAMGLITGSGTLQGGILRPTLTVDGKTVVEDHDSSIRAYQTRDQSPASGQTTVTIEGGTFSGQLSIGNSNQLTQSSGTAPSELADLIKAVLEAARGTDEEERVAKLVAQLQLEADEDEPDQAIVDKTLTRLQAVGTTSTTLVGAVNSLIQFVHDHGIAQALGVG